MTLTPAILDTFKGHTMRWRGAFCTSYLADRGNGREVGEAWVAALAFADECEKLPEEPQEGQPGPGPTLGTCSGSSGLEGDVTAVWGLYLKEWGDAYRALNPGGRPGMEFTTIRQNMICRCFGLWRRHLSKNILAPEVVNRVIQHRVKAQIRGAFWGASQEPARLVSEKEIRLDPEYIFGGGIRRCRGLAQLWDVAQTFEMDNQQEDSE